MKKLLLGIGVLALFGAAIFFALPKDKPAAPVGAQEHGQYTPEIGREQGFFAKLFSPKPKSTLTPEEAAEIKERFLQAEAEIRKRIAGNYGEDVSKFLIPEIDAMKARGLQEIETALSAQDAEARIINLFNKTEARINLRLREYQADMLEQSIKASAKDFNNKVSPVLTRPEMKELVAMEDAMVADVRKEAVKEDASEHKIDNIIQTHSAKIDKFVKTKIEKVNAQPKKEEVKKDDTVSRAAVTRPQAEAEVAPSLSAREPAATYEKPFKREDFLPVKTINNNFRDGNIPATIAAAREAVPAFTKALRSAAAQAAPKAEPAKPAAEKPTLAQAVKGESAPAAQQPGAPAKDFAQVYKDSAPAQTVTPADKSAVVNNYDAAKQAVSKAPVSAPSSSSGSKGSGASGGGSTSSGGSSSKPSAPSKSSGGSGVPSSSASDPDSGSSGGSVSVPSSSSSSSPDEQAVKKSIDLEASKTALRQIFNEAQNKVADEAKLKLKDSPKLLEEVLKVIEEQTEEGNVIIDGMKDNPDETKEKLLAQYPHYEKKVQTILMRDTLKEHLEKLKLNYIEERDKLAASLTPRDLSAYNTIEQGYLNNLETQIAKPEIDMEAIEKEEAGYLAKRKDFISALDNKQAAQAMQANRKTLEDYVNDIYSVLTPGEAADLKAKSEKHLERQAAINAKNIPEDKKKAELEAAANLFSQEIAPYAKKYDDKKQADWLGEVKTTLEKDQKEWFEGLKPAAQQTVQAARAKLYRDLASATDTAAGEKAYDEFNQKMNELNYLQISDNLKEMKDEIVNSHETDADKAATAKKMDALNAEYLKRLKEIWGKNLGEKEAEAEGKKLNDWYNNTKSSYAGKKTVTVQTSTPVFNFAPVKKNFDQYKNPVFTERAKKLFDAYAAAYKAEYAKDKASPNLKKLDDKWRADIRELDIQAKQDDYGLQLAGVANAPELSAYRSQIMAINPGYVEHLGKILRSGKTEEEMQKDIDLMFKSYEATIMRIQQGRYKSV